MSTQNNHKENNAIFLLSLGLEIGASVIVPIIGAIITGRFLDNKLNSSPLLLVVLIILGLAVSGRQLCRLIAPYLREKK